MKEKHLLVDPTSIYRSWQPPRELFQPHTRHPHPFLEQKLGECA